MNTIEIQQELVRLGFTDVGTEADHSGSVRVSGRLSTDVSVIVVTYPGEGWELDTFMPDEDPSLEAQCTDKLQTLQDIETVLRGYGLLP